MNIALQILIQLFEDFEMDRRTPIDNFICKI